MDRQLPAVSQDKPTEELPQLLQGKGAQTTSAVGFDLDAVVQMIRKDLVSQPMAVFGGELQQGHQTTEVGGHEVDIRFHQTGPPLTKLIVDNRLETMLILRQNHDLYLGMSKLKPHPARTTNPITIPKHIRRPRLQQGEHVRGAIASSKGQEARSKKQKKKKKKRKRKKLEGCNLDLELVYYQQQGARSF